MSTPRPIPRLLLDDTPFRRELEVRLWGRVSKLGDEACWEWTGPKFHWGHGFITHRMGGRQFKWMVHRLVYAWEHGDLWPFVIDHLCGNTCCVNPLHLQAVTSKVNTLRGEGPSAVNAQKDRCVHGHPLYGENLYVEASGKRVCRACTNARSREWRDSVEYGGGGVGTRTFKRHGPSKTHCVNGHPWVPENIRVKKNGHHECRVCYLAHKREWSKKRRAREREVREVSRAPSTAEQILAVLGDGSTVMEVAERLGLSRAAVSMSINRLQGRGEVEAIGTVRGKGPVKRVWVVASGHVV